VEGIVNLDGRYGLVYERVLGVSMLKSLSAQPWTLFRCARLLAELHARVHTTDAPQELPAQQQRLRDKILAAPVLPSEVQQTALQTLATLPMGNQLCHGDFHPDNVLITDKGPMIIDWMDATRGYPLADMARSSLLLQMAALPQNTPLQWLPNVARVWFHRLYLKRYFQLRPGDQMELAIWRLVNAAARLNEDVPEAPALLAYVQMGLGEGKTRWR
jgi:aminoglycoside phosphotransferase (APT) family kinase protein